MNPEKAKLLDILKNDEYKAIISAIGAGVGPEFAADETNYGKVIIMTDADTDGAHIQVLLLTFFYRYMKPLIDSGKVYIAQPPLYKVTKKNQAKLRSSNTPGRTSSFRSSARSLARTRSCKGIKGLEK